MSKNSKGTPVPRKKSKVKEEVEEIINPSPVNRIDNSWEQLDSLYVAQAEALIHISTEVNKVVQHEDFLNSIKDKEKAIITIRGFKNDIETLTKDLVGIKTLHQHRHGPINNEKDLMDSLNIFDDYVNFQNRFDTCVEPVLDIITDLNIDAQLDKLEQVPQPDSKENTNE